MTQKTLSSLDPMSIIIDRREMRNPVVIALEKLGASLIFKTIEIGDYVVSDSCAFEYKTANDFLNSIVGAEKGKAFRQCSDLAANYAKPCLLIGCELDDLFTLRNIHSNAIWAFLQTIAWFRCPVRFVPTPEIAANYIFETAKKEQQGLKTPFCEHGQKTKKTTQEQMIYVVSSIPTVGITRAESLLKRFGSIEYIAIATQEELEEVPEVGHETSKKIKEILSGYAFPIEQD